MVLEFLVCHGLANLLQHIEACHVQLLDWRLRDLLADECSVRHLEQIRVVVDDLVYFTFIGALQVPELLKDFIRHEVFADEQFVYRVRPLNYLLVGLPWIPDHIEHIVHREPLIQLCNRYMLLHDVPGVKDDRVEIANSLEPRLEHLRIEVLLAHI